MLFPDFSMTFHNTAFPQNTSSSIKRKGKDKELEFGFAVIVIVIDESLTI
jgi:hypothetical protein